MKQCRVCNRDIIISNARVLCGRKSCDTKNKKILQQISKKKEQAKTAAEGKVCKRCMTKVHELGMKSYCAECSEIMKSRHFSSYIPKEKKEKKCNTNKGKQMRRKKKCPKCTKLITMDAKLCQACNSYERVGKRDGYTKSKKPIAQMFLVRGAISGGNRGYMMDG